MILTTTEINQAKKLGNDPEQIRMLGNILDQRGMRKTQKNLVQLLYAMQAQGQMEQ
jgi:hypothetical protein